VRPLLAWTTALAVGGAVLAGCSGSGHGSPAAVASPAPTPPPGAAVSALTRMHWSVVAADPLGPRQDAVTAWTGKVLVAVGGTSGTGTGDGPSLAGADAYDPVTRVWQRLPDFPLAVRSGAASTWTGYGLVLWGGDANPVGHGMQNHALGDGAILDVASKRWHVMPKSPLPALIAPVAVTDAADRVIIMGGQPVHPSTASGGTQTLSRLVASYDPSSGTWHQLPPLPATENHDLVRVSAAAWGDGVLVAETWQHIVPTGPGSIEGSGGVDLFSLDPSRGQWKPFTAPASTPLVGADLRPLGSSLVIAGGTTCPPGASCPFTLIEPFSIVDARGQARAKLADVPIRLGAATAVGDSYVVMTGSQISGPGRDEQPGDIAAFAKGTRRWIVLPSARRFKPEPQSLTWTGRELIAVSPTGLIALGPN
jgi:hypothetical protein